MNPEGPALSFVSQRAVYGDDDSFLHFAVALGFIILTFIRSASSFCLVRLTILWFSWFLPVTSPRGPMRCQSKYELAEVCDVGVLVTMERWVIRPSEMCGRRRV